MSLSVLNLSLNRDMELKFQREWTQPSHSVLLPTGNNSKSQLPLPLSSPTSSLNPSPHYTTNYFPNPNSTSPTSTQAPHFHFSYSNKFENPWNSTPQGNNHHNLSSPPTSTSNSNSLSTSMTTLGPFPQDKLSPQQLKENNDSIYKKNPSIFSFVKHPRPYKKRRRLTENETKILLEQFNKNPMPSARTRSKLATLVPGMTERTVQIWFQNRRAKMRLTGLKTNFSRSDSESLRSSEGSESDHESQEELENEHESQEENENENENDFQKQVHFEQQLASKSNTLPLNFTVNNLQKKNEMPLSLILQAIPEFEAKEKEKDENKKKSMSINFLLD